MNKKTHPLIKSQLHPRNRHRGRYDFTVLIKSCPALAPFVKANAYADLSIDFFNPQAVIMLNKALLKHYYNIDNWNIPKHYLCPPIPSRADYLHYIADLLASSTNGIIPKGQKIKCLDIGVGANCIYPIIGNYEFGWSFIGSDIDAVAINSAQQIIAANPHVTKAIHLRKQNNANHIFHGMLQPGELIDLSICNPPFHSSADQARLGTLRKITNLTGKKGNKPVLNFGGQHHELWCTGGERQFIKNMILESKHVAASCFWFSTLISKKENLEAVYQQLKNSDARAIKVIPMQQGNKISRIVAWTFLTAEQQQHWITTRWTT